MATFNLNSFLSFTAGTAAADTFNLGAYHLTVLGLDGDDVFQESISNLGTNYLDGGNGNDSFTLPSRAGRTGEPTGLPPSTNSM
jgi:Ca2+-binding RTX toxin-like protein